jgi:hypothetical protein
LSLKGKDYSVEDDQKNANNILIEMRSYELTNPQIQDATSDKKQTACSTQLANLTLESKFVSTLNIIGVWCHLTIS